MQLRVRVKQIDHDGFLGRDHHPVDGHVGMEGTVTNIDLDPNMDDEDDAWVKDNLAHPIKELTKHKSAYQVFYVVLDNGDKVELMGHEIELVSAVHDGDL